ncbi:mitochondrial import inner membrane translocase subunit Tim9 [Caerostris darwini]|uniref:Mitochondrial import inner membrane translocase subunit n=1 Tax=Caerostris darwini TaxID=1538125 RepID=A0AAV4UYY0_9ARAC|nr:mitochondrial import inner membrane translocase subunit Tim9 [Caerostris darwini]
MASKLPSFTESEEIQQAREMYSLFLKISEKCFLDCVHDFSVITVRDKEDRCALNCTDKYMKMSQRLSQRFLEFQILSNENAIAAAKRAGQSPS